MTKSQLTLPGFKNVDQSQSNLEKPNTYKGIYAMHKYWSKKPHNLVSQYIEKYSSDGDIVLDSFCGSGISVIESVRLNRRAVGIDINPIAIFITRMGLEHIEIDDLEETYNSLVARVEKIINSLYKTNCPVCGNPNAITTHSIWKDQIIKEVWIECKECKTKKSIRTGQESDIYSALNPKNLEVYYPSVELFENARINVKKGTQVSDLFTPRALVALSLLRENIHSINNDKIRETLEFCFSASLPQTSNLVFVIRRRSKGDGEKKEIPAEVGSWVIGYWVPNEHFEINVIRCFKNRFRRILKGKNHVNQVIPISAPSFDKFEPLSSSDSGYWILTGTSTNIPIPSNSIDYVFTDPPHGNRIPYLELSLMWNTWLGFDSIDWENEIIISEAKTRNKGQQDYIARLKIAFVELYRVLKPQKFFSLAFNSLDDETWLSVLNACTDAGFEIHEITPLAYSAGSVVQDTRKNALKTDFVITWKKGYNNGHVNIKFDDDQENMTNVISDFVDSMENGNVKTYQILNHLIVSGVPLGKIFRVTEILKLLEKDYIFEKGNWRERIS